MKNYLPTKDLSAIPLSQEYLNTFKEKNFSGDVDNKTNRREG